MNKMTEIRNSRGALFASVLTGLAVALIALWPRPTGDNTATEADAQNLQNKAFASRFISAGYQLCLQYRDPAETNACAAFSGCVARGRKILESQLAAEKNPSQRTALLESLGDLHQLQARTLPDSIKFFSLALEANRETENSHFSRWMLLMKKATAELRFGELQNCILNHNAQSCIFPLSPAAIHKNKAGSEAALATLQELRKMDPANPMVRWLMNLTYMTLGRYPSGVPEEILMPLKLFRSEIPFPQFNDIAMNLGVARQMEEGGALAEDLNGDGNADILFTQRGPCNHVSYFQSDGKGGYEDKTKASGLFEITNASSAIQGDYDNDGTTDLYFPSGSWEAADFPFPSHGLLMKNLGSGKFQNVTEAAGLTQRVSAVAAAWFDYNNDGWLDLFVCNENNGPYLYENQKNGTFRNVIAQTGISNSNICKSVALGDVNGDGFLDLYLGNWAAPNKLYLNEGNGTFKEITSPELRNEPRFPLVAWFFDANNDGHSDLFAGNFNGNVIQYAASLLKAGDSRHSSKLFLNGADNHLRDSTEETSLSANSMSMSGGYGDLNNDGFDEIYQGGGGPALWAPGLSKMYLNQGGKKFVDVTEAGGFGSLQKTHGISFGDLNNDGYPELVVSRGGAFDSDRYITTVQENPGAAAFHNHWIQLRLEGTKSNRSAIGAKVEAIIKEQGVERRIYKTLIPGSGYQTNPLLIQIGIGAATSIDSLKVRWPAPGGEQSFRNIRADRRYWLKEGDSSPRAQALHSFSFPKQIPDEKMKMMMEGM